MKAITNFKIAVPFLWIGFVAAISFMEAWLKFTVPGVTLVTGLSIGKVVFGALNKVEIVFALILIVSLLVSRNMVWSTEIFLMMVLAILFVQSVWILPSLSSRIDIYLSGNTPPASNLHFYFIAMESVKLIALLFYGFKQLTTLWKI